MNIPQLVAPHYAHKSLIGRPHVPSFAEVLIECARVFLLHSKTSYQLTTINFAIQCALIAPFLYFLFAHPTLNMLLVYLASVFFLGTVYNTLWYHRYCSHKAFTFKNRAITRIFLYTNPLAIIFREEIYAIPHRTHHALTDQIGDPYGPHLGWLASFLSPELTQRIETNVTNSEFELLKHLIKHIGFDCNDFAKFRATGSIERKTCYLVRVILGQMFWGLLLFSCGGKNYLVSWYAAIFTITCLIRDFNWRGHGGYSGFQKATNQTQKSPIRALNQWFYGYLASEWHANHHKYPFSANNGFTPGQIDIAFLLIKLMKRCGIVSAYNDAKPQFDPCG